MRNKMGWKEADDTRNRLKESFHKYRSLAEWARAIGVTRSAVRLSLIRYGILENWKSHIRRMNDGSRRINQYRKCQQLDCPFICEPDQRFSRSPYVPVPTHYEKLMQALKDAAPTFPFPRPRARLRNK